MNSYILGLSFDYHDSAAAILLDGKVIAAAEEERFSRLKHDHKFPFRAIEFCLQRAGIDAKQLVAVTFYEKPFLKFDRIVSTGLKARRLAKKSDYLNRVLDLWMHQGKFDAQLRISDFLKIPIERIHTFSHHDSHAAAAFYCSPFDTATVITMDGVGEYETLTISAARNSSIEKVTSLALPDSLGLFYSAFTAFLGFMVNEGEYKVMGMAGFGEPVHIDRMRDLLVTTPDGLFSVNQDFFDFQSSMDMPFDQRLIELFGAPREPESEFHVLPKGQVAIPGSQQAVSRYYADIAASLQKRTEEVILHVVKHAVKLTGIQNVCIGGGVGLNSLANMFVQRELGVSLYVHPASGDSGGALGSALHHHHARLGHQKRGLPMENVYLGEAYTDEEIRGELRRHNISKYRFLDDKEELVQYVVNRLIDNKVVGWMQGRFEWGPRALGNRSIIANPTHKDMQETVNVRIKFREPFRPFAPSILEEYAHEYFDIGEEINITSPEMFMLAVARVRTEKVGSIPAVTHFDGTARVQIVSKRTNPLYYRLIEVFAERTGVPVLLNTSFNLRGEAMVNKPYDALETFYWSEMDSLVMNSFLIDKIN
jgi:carbamoyltransferase